MPHAMETLELKFSIARQAQYHAGGIGIVGGKLGENLSLGIEQNYCTLLVAEVGVGFAGKHRVAFQPQFLYARKLCSSSQNSFPRNGTY